MFYMFALLVLASAVNGKVDKATIADGLEKALSYLKNEGNLDINTTFYIIISDAELIYLEWTAQSITDVDLNKVNDWRKSFGNLIDAIKTKFPNAHAIKIFFYPVDWVNNGDYRFRANRVSGPASPKTDTEIYAMSNKTDTGCDNELYNNTKSDVVRSCGISQDCFDKVTSIKEEGDFEATNRVMFLSSLRLLKCEENPPDSFRIVRDICNLVYKDVLRLTASGYNQKKVFFYMDKVWLCGRNGFPEFYADEILQILRDEQNADGSIGTESIEVKKLLTAQYVAILSSAFRLKVAGIV